MAHRLSAEGLRRACLHIRLATERAQRERQSYGAVLAARQSWDSWPDVCTPERAEQASLLLQSEDHEHKVEALSQTPQQALLQLLVLTQEQERRQLMALLHTLRQEEIQGPSCTQQGPKEGTSTAEEGVITKVQPFIWVGGGRDLRADCVRKLQLIHSHLKSQGQSQPRTQDCGQVLLMDLLRLQDVQASVLLSVLLDMSPDALPSLLEDWRCSLQAQCESNLHQLLSSAQPETAAEQSSSVTSAGQWCSSVTSEEEQRSSVGAPAAEASAQHDLCADCGATIVALPYLEVLGASDISVDPNTAEEEPEEPQASLITMAWSKPYGLDYPDQGEEGQKESNESEQQQTQCGTDTGDELQDHHTQLKVTKCEENTVQVLVPDDLLTSSPNSSCSDDVAVRVEDEEAEGKDPLTTAAPLLQETRPEMVCFGDREQAMSVADREQAVRSLVDLQRRVEQRQQRDRQRQLLKVQERLSIIQSRKAEEEQLGLKDRLKLLTHDLAQEDLQQQKALVKERLDQLRRERSCILMSKRDKNTAGFKELLGPAGLHHIKIKEDAD
uniref:Uncharacterized protein n=1 Tax=Knipowitschia caucasica TaxID=637954 RepID=A0AAV2KTQ2_KNICA